MAIASAVIGGTLLTGGSGTLIGALIGALVLGILKDGFTLLGVSAFTFDMILGGGDPRDHGGQRPSDPPARQGEADARCRRGPAMLRAEHVAKPFGRVTALKDINLRLGAARSWVCWATTAPANRR